MIDRAKLMALSVETLQALKKSVSDVIEHKQRSDLRIGSIVSFFSSKRNRKVTMYVKNFGPKNLLGYEIDAQGTHNTHLQWRVHPSVVTVVGPALKVVVPTGQGGDRPVSGGLHAGMF